MWVDCESRQESGGNVKRPLERLTPKDACSAPLHDGRMQQGEGQQGKSHVVGPGVEPTEYEQGAMAPPAECAETQEEQHE